MKGYVSIIVPVYNAEKTLERCVDSLLGQTYRELEILLVNDGSNDGSLAICQRYAQQDSRVRVIDKPNGGVSSARNAGLDAAQGEYIMFCDSDDWAEPNWCQCMVENYVPGDLTVCDIAREDIQEEKKEKNEGIEIVQRRDFLHYPLLVCSPVNKIYFRPAINRNQLRFTEGLSLGEDFTFVMQYLSKISGCVRFIYRKMYHYDITVDGSLSKKIPTVHQCDKFYQLLTASMVEIGATDNKSIALRDFHIISHYEKVLIDIANRKDVSLCGKMKSVGQIQKMESFRTCCGGLQWGNVLYQWFYKKRNGYLIMIFLVLKSLKRNLRFRYLNEFSKE